VSAAKRPLFLLDLAEELTWLKDKAGADVAERWYEALSFCLAFK
jgi:dsDNA-binding SOS-regulon protein